MNPPPHLSERAQGDSDLGAAASALIESYTAQLNSVDTSGVVRQAIGMAVATAFFLMVYFLILRPRYKNYLAPQADVVSRLHNLVEEQDWDKLIAQNKMTWEEKKKKMAVREGYKTNKNSPWFARVKEGFREAYAAILQREEHHLAQSGLDSVAYLRLLWLNVTCFALITIITLPMLTIVDWKAHNAGKAWGLVESIAETSLMDFTINGVEGKTLYWHVGAAYIVTIIVCYRVYYDSLHLEKLRVEFYTNPAYLIYPNDMYKRCVFIADIQPTDMVRKEHTIKQNGEEAKVHRNTVVQMVKRKIFTTPSLLDKSHEIQVFEIKDPVGKQAKMAARDDLVLHLQKTLDNFLSPDKKTTKGILGHGTDRDEPFPKIYPPGLWKTKKVDALKHYREALLELDKKYKISNEVVRYAIISFRSAGNCSIFIQQCASRTGKVRLGDWELDLAPTPSGIIWRNIGMLSGVRATSYLVGYIALIVLLIVYTPPLAVVALLSNAKALTSFWPWLKNFADSQPLVFVATTATVPPVLSAALFGVMPMLLEQVARFQGAKTTNALQHRTIHWYLAFLVLSQLVLLPCLSTFFTIISQKDDTTKAKTNWFLRLWIDTVFFFAQVPTTYLSQANYWVNWLSLRWLTNTIQLAQPPWLLGRLLGAMYSRMTAQKHAKKAAPAEYTLRIPASMFSTILGLLYAPLVPFVAPVLTVGLILQYAYHKMQAVLLFETVAETGARFWLPEMDRFLLFLLISHGCLALTCALQMADGKIALMVAPAGFAVICFRFFLRTRFDSTLLLMLHPQAKTKSSQTHELTPADVKKGFGFLTQGVKLQLGKDLDKAERKVVEEKGRELLEKYDLLPLLTRNDEWMVEGDRMARPVAAPISIRRREKARRKPSTRQDTILDDKGSSTSFNAKAPAPFT